MEIVLNNPNSKDFEVISLKDLENIHETFNKVDSMKGPFEVKIFSINELISSHEMSKFKKNFDKFNIHSCCIYSNNRYTILAGKSSKIDSIFIKEQEIKNKLLFLNSKKEDILHEGTVRSGDRISSNGNLCIIGDVNPGAIVSAKKNIYVWGKLLGIAFAGKGGDNNSYITSLFLNPLQLENC